ncbi:MAG: PD-(D/E)XK nuclease family protein, partial [Polaromonas sp.]
TESWWQRLQGLVDEVAAPVAQELALAGSAARDSGVFNLPELPALPETVVIPPSAEAREDEDSASARIGKAMHRLLEWGGALSAPQVAAVAREFRLSPAQAAEAAALAQRILAGEGAWAWNQDAVAWQGNEVDLVYQGQPLRLDRLVRRKDAGYEDQWWVLDYKSAGAPQQQPALLAQLQAYRAAVQLIYPGAPVKAAFLTGQGTVVELA